MVETDWFTYAGPPKCGNHWITAAMKRAGVVSFDSRVMHVPGHVQGKPRVTLVREPSQNEGMNGTTNVLTTSSGTVADATAGVNRTVWNR